MLDAFLGSLDQARFAQDSKMIGQGRFGSGRCRQRRARGLEKAPRTGGMGLPAARSAHASFTPAELARSVHVLASTCSCFVRLRPYGAPRPRVGNEPNDRLREMPKV